MATGAKVALVIAVLTVAGALIIYEAPRLVKA